MKRAAILVRVSTDTQDYKSQQETLEQKAKQLGYTVTKEDIYAEKVSGKLGIEVRHELDRLMQNVRSGRIKYSAVMITEIPRLSRDPQLGRKIYDELVEHKVPLYINNLRDYSLDKNGERAMHVSIMFQVFLEGGKQELNIIKTRMKQGKITNARKGNNTGGIFTPYGYRTTESQKLVVDDEQAKVIKKIFDWVVNDNLGTPTIANLLMKQKIKTKSQLLLIERAEQKKIEDEKVLKGEMAEDKRKKYKPLMVRTIWDGSTICQIIKNPLYKGVRKYKIKGSDKDAGIPAQYEYFENCVPAIVDDQTWQKANDVLNSKSVVKERNLRYLYLLQNKITCGCCTKSYHAKYRSAGGVAYYMCYNRKFASSKCKNAGIGITDIESAVFTIIKHKSEMFEYFKAKDSDLSKLERELTKLQMEIEATETSLTELAERRKREVRAYAMGGYTECELQEILNRVDRKKAALETALAISQEALSAKKKRKKSNSDYSTYVNQIARVGKNRIKIGEILKNVLDNVIINSIGTDYKPNEFIITVYSFGTSKPDTRIIRRKEQVVDFVPEVSRIIKYNDEGKLLNSKEVFRFIDSITDKQIPSKLKFKSKNLHSRNIEVIPFNDVKADINTEQIVMEASDNIKRGGFGITGANKSKKKLLVGKKS